ncbi:conjugal transfer protein TraE [Vibrio harveyi]|uniref:VirB4 family type IV secretion/conjugal transfer ATPase n=1 Tax=Vibrio harveyi TaxID=669 RepID=UPI003CE670D4
MSENGLKTIPIHPKLPKYGYPINKNMIALDDGRLMAMFHIKGIPFESEATKNLEMKLNSVKTLMSQLAKLYGSDLGIWTHIVKRKDSLQGEYHFDIDFVTRFAKRYLDSFSGERFFTTDYYLTLVFKYSGSLSEGEAEFHEMLKMTTSVLKEFEAELLGIEENGQSCTLRHAEFLSYLLNHYPQTIPLTKNKVIDAIGDSDWHFNYDVMEIRNAHSNHSQFGVFYELDGYPNTTSVGMWDFILSQPTEFVLTQSMILMKPFMAQKRLMNQKNLIQSGHHSEDELEDLELALDTVTMGNVNFGDYHCTLAVFADSEEEALKNGSDLHGKFLSTNAVFRRSNLSSLFSFLSMMPASTYRMMPEPKSTTNLACSWSLHNYSQGKAHGNPLGDGTAVIPLKTISDTLYYFNCHASPAYQNVRGQKYAGHTMILGASGAGKTTLEGTIVAFLTRFNPQMFAIDYNRSTELFMRVYGAQYFAFSEGTCTGINPYQLKDTPKLRSFLLRLTKRLAANQDGQVTDEEELEIKQAIDTVMTEYPHGDRGLSAVLQSIQRPQLRLRLSKWCRSENGQYAWCLDAPTNQFDPEHMNRIGFDTTLLINSDPSTGKPPEFSEPLLGVLFFLKELMQKEGQLLVTIVEEFWAPANFPLTQASMKDTLKAGRIKNEFMILSSQSPEDAIQCEIFPAIIQQTATKVYLPNPDAEYHSYSRCNVEVAEFEKLTKLSKTSRTFLVKQSNTSCFAKLDLAGFDEFLPIISATTDNLELCDHLRSIHGDNWLSHFEATLK